MRGFVVVLAALPGLAIACGSFLEATTIDADGGADASAAADSEPAPEAGGDGGANADGATTFCTTLSPSATYCTDFESSDPIWSIQQAVGSAAIVDFAGAPSGTKVFETRGSLAQSNVRGVVGPQIDRSVSALQSIELSANVFVEAITDGQELDVLSLVMRSAQGAEYTIDVEVESDGALRLEENKVAAVSGTPFVAGRKFEFGKWTRLSLVVTFTVGSSSAEVRMGNDVVVSPQAMTAHTLSEVDVAWVGEPGNQYTTWVSRFDDAYVKVVAR
jgi:hypothetical protein